ncbi:MAG: GNAT family N-acetyltransferase [Acidobacteria bacterium]|nr:GNAT family N-acetyltransferase [Acidobacteriota bacterium]NIQ85317.1 GNAT family N-acetyltransferase [Acidobacteriota bacterium]
MSEPTIRHGQAADLDALMRIYEHYVRATHVTFDLEPPPREHWESWMRQFSADGAHQLLVADAARKTVGYACSTPFKRKAAYAVAVETTVYLAPDETGRGLGRALLSALLGGLPRAVHRAFAGIALPNEASEALHRKLGYRRVGVLTEAGKKFDRYWDVAWYEKSLGG